MGDYVEMWYGGIALDALAGVVGRMYISRGYGWSRIYRIDGNDMHPDSKKLHTVLGGIKWRIHRYQDCFQDCQALHQLTRISHQLSHQLHAELHLAFIENRLGPLTF